MLYLCPMETLLVIRTAKLDCWRQKLAGISIAAAERGWRVQVVESMPTATRLHELVEFWQPVGLIAECSAGTPRFNPTVPTVFLDLDPSDFKPSSSHRQAPCHFVRHDPDAIAKAAARELMSLGLRHFAFVGWFHPTCWSDDKRQAFAHMLALHGFGVSEFSSRPADERNTIAFQKRLREWIRSLPKPCGIFAVNDHIAEAVLSAIDKQHGDFAVIGVDNDESLCERSYPTITSIQPDFTTTGRVAVEILSELPFSHRQTPLTTVPPIGIVRRQSTRLAAKKDKEVDAALEMIRRHACSGLTAEEVFKTFNCSRRFAEMRFREMVGRTVLKEIHRVRLETARRLLEDPKMPVKTIANRCGWNSDAIFRRIYLKTFGVLPRKSTYPASGG